MHPGCELLNLLSNVCADQNYWWEWLNMHLGCKLLSQCLIRTTDENGWTLIQAVSCSSVSEQIRTTDESGWTLTQAVSHFQSRSEPLMRMAEHSLDQAVSCSPVFEQIRITTNIWTFTQAVSPSSVWAGQNYWWEWLNTHPESELLSSVWADQNHWQEWLNTHPESEFLFIVWGLTRTAEHTSRKWVAL